MLRGEVQQVLSDNGVVRNFFLMAVAEDQHGGRRGCGGLFIVCLLGVAGIGTARLMFITVGFRFVLHARFCQLLFVPLLGDGALAVVVAIEPVVIVVPRTPQPGVVVAQTPTPAPSGAPASAIATPTRRKVVVSAECAEAIGELIA